MKNIIIIGSGIGGLCSAVRLLCNGFKVTILEKQSSVGGKVNIKQVNDFKFDLTASILMTPHIYTDIFKYAGRNYEDYFELINIDPIYSVFYPENPTIYMYYQSAVDDTLCNSSKSVLNIMIRVLNLSFKNISWTKQNIMNYRNKIIEYVSKNCLLGTINLRFIYDEKNIQRRNFYEYNI